MKYEKNYIKSEVKLQAGPANVNIRRLFDSQDPSTLIKSPLQNIYKDVDVENRQKFSSENPRSHHKKHKSQQKNVVKEKEISSDKQDCDGDSCHRIFSADSHRMSRIQAEHNRNLSNKSNNKTNVNENQHNVGLSHKPKGFIRPRSSSQTKSKYKKKTDPVALYQSYQKDWKKFRTNICEASHSDLRWGIRDKLLNSR